MQDIEFKELMGIRRNDDDGFTYVSGPFKNGRKKRSRNRNLTRACRRHDKRAVKAKALRRIIKEMDS